jgi:hypothetical protein
MPSASLDLPVVSVPAERASDLDLFGQSLVDPHVQLDGDCAA